MLPKSLHPPVCVLSTVCGQSVSDLLSSILVANADILHFTLRVFLCRSYPGLLETERERDRTDTMYRKPLQAEIKEI